MYSKIIETVLKALSSALSELSKFEINSTTWKKGEIQVKVITAPNYGAPCDINFGGKTYYLNNKEVLSLIILAILNAEDILFLVENGGLVEMFID